MRHFIDSFDDVNVFILTDEETRGCDGKILIKWSKAGNATCGIISNKLGINFAVLGKASGYGYDKISAAVSNCLSENGFKEACFGGQGESAITEWFLSKGIECFKLV